MKKQAWLWISLAVGLVVLIGAAAILYPMLSKEVQTPDAEQSAQTIPYVDFTAVDAEGNEVSLSDYIGKPIVLNFWASWCPPCKSEMPDFDAVAKELDGEVVFLMVDMVDGMQETKEKGEQFVKEQGFSFSVLYDVNQDAAMKYGVSSLPTTYFINKDGNIVTGAMGAISKTNLLKGIEMIQ